MRLSNFSLMLAVVLLLGIPSLGRAWVCEGDLNPACGAPYHGVKEFCDFTPDQQARIYWGSGYWCNRYYSSWIINVKGLGFGDIGSGFWVVPCNGGDCREKPECEKWKNLFNPPPADCKFEYRIISSCRDGEGNWVKGMLVIKASDGRTATLPYGDQGSTAECMDFLHYCDTPDDPDSACWDESDFDNKPPDSEGCPLGQKRVCVNMTNDGCLEYKCVRSHPDDHPDDCYEEVCDTNPETGEKSCVQKVKESCSGDGGGPGDGGGDGGDGTGDGGGGGDGDGTGDGGGDGGGNGNGNGDGTGDGTGEGEGGLTEGNIKGAAENALNDFNKNGEYDADKQQAEQKKQYDRLADAPQLDKIKKHKYIQTSGSNCKLAFSVFGRGYSFSLCEWSAELESVGKILKAVVGLLGLLIILRGGHK